MAKHDDGFVWKDDHYEVRHFFAVDIVMAVVMVIVAAVIVISVTYLYRHRNDDPTTVDRRSSGLVHVSPGQGGAERTAA